MPYTQAIFSVAFAPSGEKLAVSCFDRDIDIWDWRHGTREQLRGHTGYVSKVAFLDDASLISASVDRSIKIWDLPTRRERLTLEGGAKMFESMAISPDQTVIATGTRDGTIRLFRRATEQDVRAAGW